MEHIDLKVFESIILENEGDEGICENCRNIFRTKKTS